MAGYMSNDSALYVTGSVALSSSLYISWGAATGSATAVGIRQNNLGTLEYKDNATGSWTEFGSSFDDTTLGDAASDVITINGQLTASADAQFNSNVTLGNACTDSIQVSGSLTASCDTLILDDKKIYFGSHRDASIEYNEDGNNRLIISGAYAGIEVTGSMYISGSVYANEYIVDTITTTVTNIEQQGSTKFGDSSDDTHEFTGSIYVSDDSKIYFGADNDASIEYDEDGTDELIISGAAGGIQFLIPEGAGDAFALDSGGTGYLQVWTTGGGRFDFFKDVQIADDKKLYFGNGNDASLEYDEDSTDQLRLQGDVFHLGKGLTGSAGMLISDDAKLYFGTNEDASIEYDENGRNRLIISGSAEGIEITGSTYFQDTAYFGGGIAGQSPLQINTDALLVDDKKLYFGTGQDASIEYNEDGNDRLIISGSTAGIEITGSVYVSGSVYANEFIVDTVTTTVTNIEQRGSTKFGDSSDDTHEFTGSIYVSDDSKIYFGADNDASIEYDEDGTDELIISGALGGIDIQAPVGVTDAFTFSVDGTAYMTINTIGSGVTKFAKATQHFDDVELYFGTLYEAAIKYDESGRDRLIISGSAAGIEVTGSTYFQDTAYFGGGIAGQSPLQLNTDALLVDDKKLYFGTGQDASIEYDENGRNRLIISGSTAGIEITGSAFHTGSYNLSGTLTITGPSSMPMLVMDDSDASAQIGRTHIGYDGTNSDMAIFAHQDNANQTDFALRQRSNGQTEINAKSGQSISFKVASANKAILNSSGHLNLLDDIKLIFGTHEDASIEYDENGTDRLTISGSAAGITITGSIRAEHINSGSLAGPGSYVGLDVNNQLVLTASAGGGGTPGGSNTQIQYNDGGSFDGISVFTWDDTDLKIADDTKLYFGTNEDASIEYDEDGTDRLTISGSAAGIDITGSVTISGDITPYPDNSLNLGSANYRWANVYTGDLHLKNDRGDWTIVEEEDYICVVNNRTNKRYKMMLEEIED